MFHVVSKMALASCLLAGLPAAMAAETPDTAKAVELGLDYKADLLSNLSGGLQPSTTALDHLGVTIDIDGQKAWQIPGLKLHGQLISDQGGKLNANSVGSLQGVDNIEVPQNGVRVFEAWAEKSFAQDRYSVLAGRYDVNSEFYVTPASQVFLNPVFGTGAEMAQSNPSIFPVTAFGVRGKAKINDQLSAQAAVVGVPGTPQTPSGTQMQLLEGDWQDKQGKVGIGTWRYTRATPRLDSALSGKNSGAYLLAEHVIHRDARDPERSTSVFARLGRADPALNGIEDNLSAGINLPSPGSKDDRIGLAVTQAKLSNAYLAQQAALAAPVRRQETILEATWRHKAGQHLWLQPDLQFIHHPGTSAALSDAWVIGGRAELNF